MGISKAVGDARFDNVLGVIVDLRDVTGIDIGELDLQISAAMGGAIAPRLVRRDIPVPYLVCNDELEPLARLHAEVLARDIWGNRKVFLQTHEMLLWLEPFGVRPGDFPESWNLS